MADKKISQLATASTVNTGDVFPLVQAGSTLQCSIATLLANLPSLPTVVQTPESPSSGALSLSIETSLVTSATGVTNYTLAAGTNGQAKMIAAQTMGGSASVVVTITSGTNIATVTFNAAGQSASLKNIGGYWFVKSVGGKTLPTLA
jgi:hypothetical protein